MSRSSSRVVVILALDTLGDLVLRQPLFSGLLDSDHAVTVVVRRGYEEIVPYLDKRLQTLTVSIDPYKPPDELACGLLNRLVKEIASLRPDILVAAAYNRTYAEEWVLHQFPDCESVGFALPSSILDRLPTEIRPKGTRRRELLSRAVTCAIDDHEAAKQRALFAGVTRAAMEERLPQIALDMADREAAAHVVRALGLEPGHYIFGCPAGTRTVSLKAWPVNHFIETAEGIWRRHQLPVLVAGVASEAPLLNEIAEAGATRGIPMPVWIGASGTMGTLLGLIAHSRLYLGNDTGPMHCAGALGVSVVARFGGGHWPRFLPLARRAFTATQKLPCFGCGWQCWLDTPACMTTVEPDTFVAGADWVLSSNDAERRVDVGAPVDARAAETLIAAATVTVRLKAELEKARAYRVEALKPVKAEARRPKVFVVTPSFNQGRYLRDTIDSVLRQDYENLAYFVSDAGSTDDSVEILKSYGDRVRWTSAPDGGQAAAIARAWSETDAEIVAWLNSDDTYLDGAISAAVDYLMTHPEAAMVYGQAWYTNAVGRQLRPYPTKPFDREALAGDCFICQPAAFVRREVFKIIELPDANLRYCMDYDLWIRISRHFQIKHFERFVATSRLHAENKTLGEGSGAMREAMHVAKRHFGSVHPNWALKNAQMRVGPLAARFFGPTRRFGLWLSRRMAHRLASETDSAPFFDGWTGPRTVVQVDVDESGIVRIDGDFPVWPYRGVVRIIASCENRVVAVHHLRRPDRFTMTMRIPDASKKQVAVVLQVNRSFSPILDFGWTDARTLSFRLLEVRGVKQSEPADDLWQSDRLSRISRRLRFLPEALRHYVCGIVARGFQPPKEAEPAADGWVGDRAAVTVSPDQDGRVVLNCDSPLWPYRRWLRITVYHQGKKLMSKRVGKRGPFVLDFVLPRAGGLATPVLLVANKSFVPVRYGISSTDPRPLAFRVLDEQRTFADRPQKEDASPSRADVMLRSVASDPR